MNLEGFIITIVIGVVAYIVGYMMGIENERRRIYSAFSLKNGISLGNFNQILGEYEDLLESIRNRKTNFIKRLIERIKR
jgi:hypothetical protein